MGWCGNNLPSNEWWQAALNSEYVITRDEAKSGLAGISDVRTDNHSSSIRYNLAGIKVDATYKGIVVEDGKKYVSK